MPTAQTLARRSRIMRIRHLINVAHSKNQTLSYEKVIDYIMSEYFVTRRVSMEYIDSAISGGFATLDGDIILKNASIGHLDFATDKEVDDILKID